MPRLGEGSRSSWQRRSARCSCTASSCTSLGNMLFLWIFGNNVEDAIGRVRFLIWYLARRARGDRRADFHHPRHWATRAGRGIPNVGASGAIAGVLGAYFVLSPRAGVLTAIILGSSSCCARFRRSSSSASGSCSSCSRAGSRSSSRRREAASPSSRTSAASSSGCSRCSSSRGRSASRACATGDGLRRARAPRARLAAARARARRSRTSPSSSRTSIPTTPTCSGSSRSSRTCRRRSRSTGCRSWSRSPDPDELERRDPHHRAARARPLLRDRRAAARRARLRLMTTPQHRRNRRGRRRRRRRRLVLRRPARQLRAGSGPADALVRGGRPA